MMDHSLASFVTRERDDLSLDDFFAASERVVYIGRFARPSPSLYAIHAEIARRATSNVAIIAPFFPPDWMVRPVAKAARMLSGLTTPTAAILALASTVSLLHRA
jgi:hypothetical protein